MSSPLLEVKDLQVTVGEEQKVLLDGLNLTVHPGETHVLMGHNGAGKSTLMSALMGDPRYTVTRGSILFRGQDVTHESADVRAKLGLFLSFQTPEEIPGITLENFLRTAQNAITGKPVKVFAFRKELAQQMEALGMDPAYADRYLNVGFSGGEKKKAEILQMLMLDSSYEVIVLDIGCGIDENFQLLDLCKKIYMPVLSDAVSQCKIAQFENLVRIWDYPQILEKTEKINPPFHMATCLSPAYVEQLMWSELGDYVRNLLRKESQKKEN